MNCVKTVARVGKIRYINSLPFYFGLTEDGAFPEKQTGPEIEFYESYPTKINLALRKGKIDIAPISSLEYLNHQENYVLLPDLAIGSRDFSGSVLLFSKEKIEGLNKARILLSRQSLSSATLLRVILKAKYKFENRFVSSAAKPEGMLRHAQAALVIGDDALFYTPKEFVYKYDLSELWWNWTGKPFCFAVWAVRRDFAKRHPEEVSALYWRLKRNLDHNLADLESLLKKAMNFDFIDERFPKVFGYLFNLIYTLDGPMFEGLELFYRFAGRLEISPRPQKIEFFEVSPEKV